MDERAVAGFREAIGPEVTHLVFRRAGEDWSVATPAGDVVWTSRGYMHPGRMLYGQLSLVLKAERPEITMTLELVSEEDWAWYADD